MICKVTVKGTDLDLQTCNWYSFEDEYLVEASSCEDAEEKIKKEIEAKGIRGDKESEIKSRSLVRMSINPFKEDKGIYLIPTKERW